MTMCVKDIMKGTDLSLVAIKASDGFINISKDLLSDHAENVCYVHIPEAKCSSIQHNLNIFKQGFTSTFLKEEVGEILDTSKMLLNSHLIIKNYQCEYMKEVFLVISSEYLAKMVVDKKHNDEIAEEAFENKLNLKLETDVQVNEDDNCIFKYKNLNDYDETNEVTAEEFLKNNLDLKNLANSTAKVEDYKDENFEKNFDLQHAVDATVKEEEKHKVKKVKSKRKPYRKRGGIDVQIN